MKKAISLILLGATAVSGVANAGIANNLLDPTATNYQTSDLVLFVSSSTDPTHFYARDLGVTMDQLLSALDATKANGSTVGVATSSATTALNFAADSALTTFLSTHAASTDTFYIVGGNPGNPGTPTLGSERYALVTNYTLSNLGNRATTAELDSIVFTSIYTFFDTVGGPTGLMGSATLGPPTSVTALAAPARARAAPPTGQPAQTTAWRWVPAPVSCGHWLPRAPTRATLPTR